MTELQRTTDNINLEAALEREQQNISTVNEQIEEAEGEILSLEEEIESDEQNIAAAQKRIRAKRRRIAKLDKENNQRRAKRSVFVRAAADLQALRMP